MIKILLICSAGMSTSLMVTKMQKISDESNLETKIWAVSDSQSSSEIEKADIILLGPQVRFLYEKIKRTAGKRPVVVMDMRQYGMMDGKAILETALKEVEK